MTSKVSTKPFTSKAMVDELKKCGITHIIWTPDSEVREMYDALTSQNDIEVVPICREGEAIAIAFGLMLGGKKAAVLHQSTGLFESGESVRCFALDLPFPLLMLVSHHGWKSKGPITNSAANYVLPILDAWGVKHYLVETDEDVKKISTAYKEAQDESKMVAILFRREGI